jgi:hypothetical protein
VPGQIIEELKIMDVDHGSLGFVVLGPSASLFGVGVAEFR